MQKPDSTARILEAGVARVVITPPVGIRMLTYIVAEGISTGVERDLTATALVLGDGRIKVAMIACDLVFLQSPVVDLVRERVGARIGIPASHVLINCSHTHLGPMYPGWLPCTSDELELQRSYLAVLERAIEGVAAMADSRRQPARIGAGVGSAPVGINRREKLPDGRVVIGENFDGAVDNQIGVLRIDDLLGRSIATVMSAAAHTVTLGPKTSLLSPDFVGPAREMVEQSTGALSLFFQGAAGNVNPRCGIGTGGPEQYDDCNRLGAVLGGEVLKTWASIRTHNHHGPRRIVQSVATVSVWDYEPSARESIEHLDVATREVELALAPLPDRRAAEETLRMHRGQLEDARASGASRGELNICEILVSWAETVMQTIDAGQNPVTRKLNFWALRVNDIGIVAVSGEPFAELALEVKRRSPLKHTLFLGYSNGCVAYLPTPEAVSEGGMEVANSYKNYRLPAPLTTEWGPAVVETSLELLNALG